MKQFAISLGVFVVLLLTVMESLSVVGGALFDKPCMVFQRVCGLCLRSHLVYRCSCHIFCLCFYMSEVISSFRSLRTGQQVFALLMLILCVILHIMSLGKSLQLLCIMPFGMVCLSTISMMFVKILLAVCIWVSML